jgi:hypothetical protein
MVAIVMIDTGLIATFEIHAEDCEEETLYRVNPTVQFGSRGGFVSASTSKVFH